MLLSDPPPIVMCDFDSRTARWGLDVPATLLARADEIMNAECPLLGVKQTWLPQRKMSAYDPKRTYHSRRTVLLRCRVLERPIWDLAPCFCLSAKAFSLAWNKIQLPAFGHR